MEEIGTFGVVMAEDCCSGLFWKMGHTWISRSHGEEFVR